MSENKLIFLGCGSSQGVPQVSYSNPEGNWGDCDPHERKNNRTRSSVYVEYKGHRLLIDSTPDLRTQYLREQLSKINAVLYTHVHSDHIFGMAELDTLYQGSKHKIGLYSSHDVIEKLHQQFPFFFKNNIFNIHAIESQFKINGATVTAFNQIHSKEISLGFRFDNLAYSTDFSGMHEYNMHFLDNLDIWIVGCTWRERDSSAHLNLKRALEWYERVKPKMMYLTHMGNTMDYQSLCAELPDNIRPAYDGLEITF